MCDRDGSIVGTKVKEKEREMVNRLVGKSTDKRNPKCGS
jgi:hypothetical protein